LREVRAQAERLLVGAHRVVVTPSLPERMTELAPGLGEVRLERGRLAEGGLGVGPLVRTLESQPVVVNALGSPRRGSGPARLRDRRAARGTHDRAGEQHGDRDTRDDAATRGRGRLHAIAFDTDDVPERLHRHSPPDVALQRIEEREELLLLFGTQRAEASRDALSLAAVALDRGLQRDRACTVVSCAGPTGAPS